MNSMLKPLVVVDTDIFYDPDDAVAAVIAAFLCPNLAFVTSDETRGRRKRLLEELLRRLGRPDVPVFEGIGLGGVHRFLMDDHMPAAGVSPEIPLLDGLIRLITEADGPVFWVGQGPMSVLARLLTEAPHLAERITLVQMGGWLDRYRNPRRGSHIVPA